MRHQVMERAPMEIIILGYIVIFLAAVLAVFALLIGIKRSKRTNARLLMALFLIPALHIIYMGSQMFFGVM